MTVIGLLALTGCVSEAAPDEAAGESISGSVASWAPSPDDRTALASTLRERLEGFIAEQDMPYVVTQAGFLEAGPEALKVGRPEGTMWVVEFDDPLPALDRVTHKSAITDPLHVYVEALRPEFESGQMDFVVNYIVFVAERHAGLVEISPTLIRLYLDGQLGIRELSRTMVITGP